jgi:hypothetical protein
MYSIRYIFLSFCLFFSAFANALSTYVPATHLLTIDSVIDSGVQYNNVVMNLGANISVVSVGSSAPTASGTYTLGQTGPAGGKVFYVDSTGKHGLEAAPVDQTTSTGVGWGCFNGLASAPTSYITVGITNTAIGTGAANTLAIIAACPGTSAAATAAAYTLNGYTDWYLPSQDELDQLYMNKSVVGGFTINVYWSSSEFYSDARTESIANGVKYVYSKTSMLAVRAVRTF